MFNAIGNNEVTDSTPKRSRAVNTVDEDQSRALKAEFEPAGNRQQGKIVKKVQKAIASVPSVEQLAAAYYMQVVDTSDLNATWSTVEKAMKALPATDFGSSPEEFTAHSVQYHKDGFMMGRARLCQLESKPQDQVFLEVAKLRGNGFIFQDQFVEQLQQTLSTQGLKALAQLEKPVANLEENETKLAFLDLSDEETAYPMIEKWLTSLQPKKEVTYDQMVVFEALSSLAWNLNDADNFKVLVEYKDDIVAHVLDILKVDETTAIPTGYFAAKVVEKFFSQESNVPDKLKVWDTVLSLEESLVKWSTPNPKALHKEVPCSRGVVTTLLSVLRNAANMMTGEPSAKALKKSETFVSELDERLASVSASWPADSNMESLCQALRVTCPARGEEEVQSA